MVPWCIFEGKELNLKAKLAILITSEAILSETFPFSITTQKFCLYDQGKKNGL